MSARVADAVTIHSDARASPIPTLQTMLLWRNEIKKYFREKKGNLRENNRENSGDVAIFGGEHKFPIKLYVFIYIFGSVSRPHFADKIESALPLIKRHKTNSHVTFLGDFYT